MYLSWPLHSVLLGISLSLSWQSTRAKRARFLQHPHPCSLPWLLPSGVAENKGTVEKGLARAHTAITRGGSREADISWLTGTLLVSDERAAGGLPGEAGRELELGDSPRWHMRLPLPSGLHASSFSLAVPWTRGPETGKGNMPTPVSVWGALNPGCPAPDSVPAPHPTLLCYANLKCVTDVESMHLSVPQ